MILRHSFTAIVLFACLAARGQDIHFSQYFASPVTLNPALIAGFNGKFRVAANYRNQWYFLKSQLNGSRSGYQTYSGSFDIRLLENKLRYDQFGVGVMIFNDNAGDGGSLSNLTAMAGAAYHKVLDEASRYSLALGVLAGITQRRIDFSELLFESQFDQNNGFIPSLPNGEPVKRSSFIYPDFTVGLLFRGRFTNSVSGYLGGSMFHLHKPKEYFLAQGTDNRLNPRFVAHGGMEMGIGEYLIFTPGFLYQIQNTASEATAGFALGYKFDKLNRLYAGMWYRIFDNDAVIAMLAYEWDGLRVGMSYDINLSDLKLASNNQGAIEASVIYIYGQQEERKFSPVDFCPKF